MKIALLKGPHQFEIVETPIPSVQPDEVLVRVAACGVCTGELDMWEGRAGEQVYPRYPGHEVSGVIEAFGESVTKFKVGEPIGVWATGNGYAEYAAVKADYCLAAGEVPLDIVLAEPLACAVNAVELAQVSLGDHVVIIGAGFMGNLVQKLVNLCGPASLVVADTRPDALERAKRLGATRVVNPLTESLADAVKSCTGGRGAEVSFEVTGVQAGLDLLGEATRMSGKVVIVGFHQGGTRQINLAYWNWMAFQILNAHFRDEAVILRGMDIGMRLLRSGKMDLGDLVTHRFPLGKINAAFKTACEKPRGFVKATILMDSPSGN